MLINTLVFVLALALGSVPFSWLIGRFWYGLDLCEVGDRNVGSGNLLDRVGFLPGTTALILDLLKGAAAVGLALALSGVEWVVLTAGVLAVIGHVYPPWLGFVGGRGAASAIGVAWALFPLVGSAMLAVGLIVHTLTRNTVLGIAIVVAGLAILVLVSGGDLGRLFFVALLFIAVGLKDAWDRVHRRSEGLSRVG